MSHKRVASLFNTVRYYLDAGIEPIVCDNTPASFWRSSGFNVKDLGCKCYANERLSFYDQLIWLSDFFINSNEELISICPDEDIHYSRWIKYSKNIYKSAPISSPITCISGPSLSFKQEGELFRISSAMPSRAFTNFGANYKQNSILAMIGQVPFLWRTYPSDFFGSLMRTVKWFGLKYGDKVAEQIVWNLLVPAMGTISQPINCVHFIRKDSLGLRFTGDSKIGRTPFLQEMKGLNIKNLAVELQSHCIDFPDRFLCPSKEFFEYCMETALNVFPFKPWQFNRNQESCFYIDSSANIGKYDMRKLVMTGEEKDVVFDYLIASALDLPILSLRVQDLKKISVALGS